MRRHDDKADKGRGTILDDDLLDDDGDDPDFDGSDYDESSDSDDTYYDYDKKSGSDDSSSSDDSQSEEEEEDKEEEDNGANLDEKIHHGLSKGTRTDGGEGNRAQQNINFDSYPGVPQKSVTGPVVAAVFCTGGLFVLAGVI